MLKTLNILNKWVAHQTEDEGMGNQLLKEARKMGPREPEKSNCLSPDTMFHERKQERNSNFVKWHNKIWNKGENGLHL